jgi:hypothetical protein
MKIAIPTSDGVNIGENIRSSRGFCVTTIKSSKIVHRELRWNLLSHILTNDEGALYNLHDCDAVIVMSISGCHKQRLTEKNKKVIETTHLLIEEAISGYIKNITKINKSLIYHQ